MAPIRQAVAQMLNATTQAVSCAVPPNQSRRQAKQQCSDEPSGESDARIHSHSCTSQPGLSDREQARGEIGKIALHDKTCGHRQGDNRAVWQHRGKAEQCVHQRR